MKQSFKINRYGVLWREMAREHVTTLRLEEVIYAALRRRALDESLRQGRTVTADELTRRALVAFLGLDFEPKARPIGRPRTSREVINEAKGVVAQSEKRRQSDPRDERPQAPAVGPSGPKSQSRRARDHEL
jgi:hypothetical protein